MKTLLKIIFGFLILLVIVVAGFLYTFDANDYKKELTTLAEKITGRPIAIGGDIAISLYPLIAIKADNVTLENPAGFSKKNFVSVGQLDVKVHIMPLLQKRLNIDTLVLNRLVVDFERNANGKENWSGLASASDDDLESRFGLNGLVVGGIEVSDADLTLLDVTTGKQFDISKVQLDTETVVQDQPLPITFKAYVKSNQPEWQGSVFVKTSLEFDENSPVVDARGLKLVVKAQMPTSKPEEITFAMIADGEVNVQTQKAKLSKAKLSALGLVMSGELEVDDIFSVPVVHGPLKIKTFDAYELANQFGIVIPQMANAQSLKKIALKTTFKTDFNSMYLDDIIAKVDESRVNGFIHITGMKQLTISYDLDVDRINYSDYRVVGSEDSQNEMPLPLDLIRSVDVAGTLDIETITVNEVQLDKLHVTSKIEKGILSATPITMLVGDSEVKAAMELDAREIPNGELAIEANNVDAIAIINPLLKTIMGDVAVSVEGMVSTVANIKVTGLSVAALKKSAQGTLEVNMDAPVIQGVDLDHESRSVVADYANKNNFRTRKSYVTEYKPDHKTEFNSLSASFKITDGKWVNDDFSMISDKANITGSGYIDFINEKLDYRPVIDMNVASAVDIRDKLRDHPMEYNARGAFENLSYKFNLDKYELLVGRLLLQEAKERSIRQQKQNTWENIKSR